MSAQDEEVFPFDAQDAQVVDDAIGTSLGSRVKKLTRAARSIYTIFVIGVSGDWPWTVENPYTLEKWTSPTLKGARKTHYQMYYESRNGEMFIVFLKNGKKKSFSVKPKSIVRVDFSKWNLNTNLFYSAISNNYEYWRKGIVDGEYTKRSENKLGFIGSSMDDAEFVIDDEEDVQIDAELRPRIVGYFRRFGDKFRTAAKTVKTVSGNSRPKYVVGVTGDGFNKVRELPKFRDGPDMITPIMSYAVREDGRGFKMVISLGKKGKRTFDVEKRDFILVDFGKLDDTGGPFQKLATHVPFNEMATAVNTGKYNSLPENQTSLIFSSIDQQEDEDLFPHFH